MTMFLSIAWGGMGLRGPCLRCARWNREKHGGVEKCGVPCWPRPNAQGVIDHFRFMFASNLTPSLKRFMVPHHELWRDKRGPSPSDSWGDGLACVCVGPERMRVCACVYGLGESLVGMVRGWREGKSKQFWFPWKVCQGNVSVLQIFSTNYTSEATALLRSSSLMSLTSTWRDSRVQMTSMQAPSSWSPFTKSSREKKLTLASERHM